LKEDFEDANGNKEAWMTSGRVCLSQL